MTDPTAQHFLDAIRAAPDDDAPRLIYADWLDERGDDDSRDRAAFIRAQCAVGNGWSVQPAAIPADTSVARQSAAAADAIEKRRGREWKRELQGLRVRDVRFDRGLIAWASMSVADFFADGDALVDRCPGLRLVQVVLDRKAPMQLTVVLERLTAARAVRRVPGLQIVGRIGDAGAERLAAADFLALTRLNLSDNAIGDRGATALAFSRTLPKLAYLDLSDNNVTRVGDEAFVRSPERTALKRLVLSGNPARRALGPA